MGLRVSRAKCVRARDSILISEAEESRRRQHPHHVRAGKYVPLIPSSRCSRRGRGLPWNLCLEAAPTCTLALLGCEIGDLSGKLCATTDRYYLGPARLPSSSPLLLLLLPVLFHLSLRSRLLLYAHEHHLEYFRWHRLRQNKSGSLRRRRSSRQRSSPRAATTMRPPPRARRRRPRRALRTGAPWRPR